MGRSLLLLAALFAAAFDTQAYCIHNNLASRSVAITQEDHPEKSREDRTLRITLGPGQSTCCKFPNLDCNPSGREEGVVNFFFEIVGEPEVRCGLPGGRMKEPQVSITGTGTLRIAANTRKNSNEVPYVVRARARDGKDLSGPAGIACRKPTKDTP